MATGGHLEALFGHLEALFGHLEALFGHLEAMLGHIGYHLSNRLLPQRATVSQPYFSQHYFLRN